MGLPEPSLTTSELQRLLTQHAPAVRTFVERRIPPAVKSTVLVDDVLQETWFAAFRGMHTFSSRGPNGFSRWIMTIAGGKVIDAVRAAACAKRGRAAVEKRSGPRLSEIVDTVPGLRLSPSGETSAREIADAVSIALSSLADDRQRAISMRHLEGLTPNQIASAMQKSVAAVNGLIFHGMRELKQRLGDASRYLSGDSSASNFESREQIS